MMGLVDSLGPYVFTAAATCWVGWLTFKNNRRGQDATSVIEGRRVDNESKRVELDGKEVDLAVLTESIKSLRERLSDVETQLGKEKEQRRLSNAYARTLAQVLRDHRMVVPVQPEGLDLP